MLKFALDILFPSSSKTAMLSVADLSSALQSEQCTVCIDTGIKGLPHRIVSAAAYDRIPIVQYALCALKYKNKSCYAESIAAILSQHIHSEIHPDMVLCPVPLHWSRYIDRGFNQSTLIAHFLSRNTALSVHSLLRRVRNTGHQAWRTREDRLHAMDDAFVVRRNVAVPKYVVLIDDIVTTGATLHACATVLQKAGVQRVDAWVIARG